MKIVKSKPMDYNGYTIEFEKYPDKSWNYTINRGAFVGYISYYNMRARYSTKRDAIESAKDWIDSESTRVKTWADYIEEMKL